jgi:hypothetical protein
MAICKYGMCNASFNPVSISSQFIEFKGSKSKVSLRAKRMESRPPTRPFSAP